MVKIITSDNPMLFNNKIKTEIENGWGPIGSHQVSVIQTSNTYSGNLLRATNSVLQYSLTMVKKETNFNIVEINTTAFKEENFILVTSLTDEEIDVVISPIVSNEREYGIGYTNDDLYDALCNTYPDSLIEILNELKVIEF